MCACVHVRVCARVMLQPRVGQTLTTQKHRNHFRVCNLFFSVREDTVHPSKFRKAQFRALCTARVGGGGFDVRSTERFHAPHSPNEGVLSTCAPREKRGQRMGTKGGGAGTLWRLTREKVNQNVRNAKHTSEETGSVGSAESCVSH